ncbi:membrane protein [Actinotalea ferrariae CF5-4]|uniref:Membrane protein n=1 Tax=Actinotalea ferrariae CF5-4 TaxID=948458 RepID=A0A021VXU1_9CELL|nr:hypothetical protein [Actinotalea ferrariae]EYR63872.1 membrane protein [Actinotalea ferrariae CF5-4]
MPDAGPPAPPLLSGRALLRLLGTGLLGLVVGVVGTSVHRAEPPWGLVLALLCVLSAGVLARAWTGWAGMLAVALGVFAAVSLLGGPGPGGDVLVALQPLGVVWYAGALTVALVALLPRRWFSDEPRAAPERRRPAVSPAP